MALTFFNTQPIAWTPTIGGSGGQSGQTYTTQFGRYVKIGRFIWLQGYIYLSAKGTITGSVQIQGLPYAAPNDGQNFFAGSVQWHQMATNWVNIYPLITSGSVIWLRGCQAAATNNATDLSTTDIANNTNFVFTIFYYTS